MIIYKITNLINGKIYVGQTTNSIEKRWTAHLSESNKSDLPLHRSIVKNGRNNFTVEEIDGANNQSELNYKEWLWVHKLNCKSPNGYNLKDGGGARGKNHESTNVKLSCIFSNDIICVNTGLIYKNSKEAADTLGLNRNTLCKVLSGALLTVKGLYFKYLDEKRNLLSEGKLVKRLESKKGPKKESVVHLNTGNIYCSISDASRELGIEVSHIVNICSGKIDQIKGHIFVYNNEAKKDKGQKTRQLRKDTLFEGKMKSVVCLNNNVEYKSITEASKKLNIPFSLISRVCSGHLKQCKNYKFKYK